MADPKYIPNYGGIPGYTPPRIIDDDEPAAAEVPSLGVGRVALTHLGLSLRHDPRAVLALVTDLTGMPEALILDRLRGVLGADRLRGMLALPGGRVTSDREAALIVAGFLLGRAQ